MIIAGYDISYSKYDENLAVACISVFDEQGEVIEEVIDTVVPGYPYEAGKLWLREKVGLDVLLGRLEQTLDVLVIDGCGTMHPKLFGAACSYHKLYGVRTVGCAKNLLVGSYEDLDVEQGSKAAVMFDDQLVGYAYRTATNVKPVFISTGCDLTQDEAVAIVGRFCRGYRIPEITRRPDQKSRERLRALERD